MQRNGSILTRINAEVEIHDMGDLHDEEKIHTEEEINYEKKKPCRGRYGVQSHTFTLRENAPGVQSKIKIYLIGL